MISKKYLLLTLVVMFVHLFGTTPESHEPSGSSALSIHIESTNITFKNIGDYQIYGSNGDQIEFSYVNSEGEVIIVNGTIKSYKSRDEEGVVVVITIHNKQNYKQNTNTMEGASNE